VKTEGLWYLGERALGLRPMEIPEPGYDEVVVQLEACGICTWDLLAYAGRFSRWQACPFVAGHEGVGRVVETGPRVRAVKPGDRVVLHEVPVGTPGGALMARHALRAERQLALVPEGPIPPHHWIVEPAACVVNGTVYAGVQPGDRVALVGAGYMGLLFVQALRRTLAARVVAFDLDDRRLALARELGADAVVNLGGGLPRGHAAGYDVVIETAGAGSSLATAMELARPGAVIENFAWHHHEQAFDLEEWHVKGWRILNVQPGMNPRFGDLYPPTVALIAAGAISNARLVTHVGPVTRADEIYRAGLEKSGGYVKGVITF
jgi:2-desacetyl-2-hydroxyethyl bacteriochlorophyllide A dehydrogenase